MHIAPQRESVRHVVPPPVGVRLHVRGFEDGERVLAGDGARPPVGVEYLHPEDPLPQAWTMEDRRTFVSFSSGRALCAIGNPGSSY